MQTLFILPGTGGLAVQQAMSFGLPVIVGAADGTQSNLVRPENGWMLAEMQRGMPEQHHQGQRWAISAVLRRMGAASYQIVNREVNLENMVAVFTKSNQQGL